MFRLLKGLDTQKMLAFDRLIVAQGTLESKRARYRAGLRDAISIQRVSRPAGISDNSTLFIKSMHRADYDTLNQQIFDQCPSPKYQVNIVLDGNPIRWACFANLLWAILLLAHKSTAGRHRVYLALRLVTYLSYARQINNLPFKHLVSFADMQPIDNIAVQLAKRRGLKTTTLQHGLYVDYAGHENVNKINYENIVAENFLAWGNETRRLLKRYHPDVRVVICGKPNLLQPSSIGGDSHFTMIFDQNLFHAQNVELLSIATEAARALNLKVNLRLHPHNKLQWFRPDDGYTITDGALENSKFVVGHTSTLIYECMRLGIPAYRYETEVPSNYLVEPLNFTNCEELLNLLDVPAEFSKIGEYYVKHIGEESLAAYRSYFAASS